MPVVGCVYRFRVLVNAWTSNEILTISEGDEWVSTANGVLD